jgi:very-short-patch-repair endonuclease
MSYGNQRDHELLDRFAVRDWLLALAGSDVAPSGAYPEPSEHLDALRRVAESELERDWLEAVSAGRYRLPDRGQVFIEAANARPDFVYGDLQVVVFVDGPVHGYADVQARDAEAQTRLEDLGFYVLRFGADRRTWQSTFEANPNVFGGRS